jgi:hypothetical protein
MVTLFFRFFYLGDTRDLGNIKQKVKGYTNLKGKILLILVDRREYMG